MRALPAWSVIGVCQTLFEVQTTVAVVAAPAALISVSGLALLPPLALFQLGSATTPATSVEAIATSWPTKSMLITLPEPPLTAVTLRIVVVVLVSEALVPVIVKVKLPGGVLLAVVTDSVELLPTLTEVGLKVPVALAGSPLTLKLIEPVNPLIAVVFTEYEVLLPVFTVCVLGAADSAKDAGPLMSRVTVVVLVSEVLVPVIVKVKLPGGVLLAVVT